MTTSADYCYERTTSPFLAMTRGLFHFLHTSPNRETGVAVRQLSILPLGTLHLPTGRLLIEDPFKSLRPHLNRAFVVEPGEYRVVQTVARIGEDEHAHQSRSAYLSLVLDEVRMAERRHWQQQQMEYRQDPQVDEALRSPFFPELPRDSFSEQQWKRMAKPSVSVLTGTVALADQDRFELLMPSDQHDMGEGWLETVFDHGLPGSWFDALDASTPLPVGSAQVQLPQGKATDQVILCRTGWGDGQYPVSLEHSQDGHPIALHVDFGLIPSDPMLALRA